MIPGPRSRGQRQMLGLVLVASTLATGCNSLFGIHEGKARPICVDPLLIDDMEDGAGDICESNGRQGGWYTVGDGTSTDLTPGPDFTPTLIPGSRDTSRFAARMTGSGFTAWGALMGFGFKDQGLATKAYDASTTGGIKFWMKSNAAVSVNFLIAETVLPRDGGECAGTETGSNCNNHFSFPITAPSNDWVEYEVPFLALSQQFPGGSATWNPRLLLGVQFLVQLGGAFDVWVDDIRFYFCSTSACVPTCTDPAFPIACQAAGHYPAGCRSPGTDCSLVAGWCADPFMIDDMEDGDPGICDSGGRRGQWYEVGIAGVDPGLLNPTLIPGGRGTSRYAARISGTNILSGPRMGSYLRAGPALTYDARAFDGVKFWMKSAGDASVDLHLPEECDDGTTDGSCYSVFRFFIGANRSEWVEYEVPFAALREGPGNDLKGNLIVGSTWDASRLLRLEFSAHSSEFDLWVDDVRFYGCPTSGCVLKCPDPAFPVACPATDDSAAGCWPAGMDCSSRPDDVSIVGVWGSGPSDVWAVGFSTTSYAGKILHWEGLAWSPTTNGSNRPIWGVWGSGASDVWTVGDHGTIQHWNGSAWSASASGTTSSFNGVWGSGSSDVWAIVFPGTMLHLNGSGWSPVTSGTQFLASVWGSGPNDVWAVGADGTILHSEGAAWSPVASGTTQFLSKVWGSSRNDVWAVGDNGTTIHWDGSAWSAVTSGTTQFLFGVWGSGPNDVWAVGDNGTIVRWDGSSWAPSPSGSSHFLNDVWGSSPNDVWVVGDESTIIHWDGSTWTGRP